MDEARTRKPSTTPIRTAPRPAGLRCFGPGPKGCRVTMRHRRGGSIIVRRRAPSFCPSIRSGFAHGARAPAHAYSAVDFGIGEISAFSNEPLTGETITRVGVPAVPGYERDRRGVDRRRLGRGGAVRHATYISPINGGDQLSALCRIGIHRWSFSTQLLDEPGHGTHTEIVTARCRRERCCRFGTWSVVHRESRLAGSVSAPGSSTIRAA